MHQIACTQLIQPWPHCTTQKKPARTSTGENWGNHAVCQISRSYRPKSVEPNTICRYFDPNHEPRSLSNRPTPSNLAKNVVNSTSPRHSFKTAGAASTRRTKHHAQSLLNHVVKNILSFASQMAASVPCQYGGTSINSPFCEKRAHSNAPQSAPPPPKPSRPYGCKIRARQPAGM